MFEGIGIFGGKPSIEIDKKMTTDIKNIKEANICLKSFLETCQTDYVEAVKKSGYDLPLKLFKAPSEARYLQPNKIAEYLGKQKIKPPALIGINENYLYLYMESKEGKKLIPLNLETLCGYKFTSAILDNLKNEDIEVNKFYYQKQGNTIRYKVKSSIGKVESGEITENDLKVKIEEPVNWTWEFKFKILEKASQCSRTTSSHYKDVFNKDLIKIRVSLSDKKEIYDLIKFKKKDVYYNLLDSLENAIADIDHILNENNGLKDIAKHNLEKQTEKEKKLREKIKNCRSIIDEILTALLSVDFDFSIVGTNVEVINKIFFTDMLIQLDQKKSTLGDMLTEKRKAKIKEKNTEFKKSIEENKKKIFELAKPVLYQYFSDHAIFTDELIVDKMIEHFSPSHKNNTNDVYHHKIWVTYGTELKKVDAENENILSILEVQEQIISVMNEYNKLKPSEKQQMNHLQGNVVQLDEIYSWFEDCDFTTVLNVKTEEADNHDKKIEICAIEWKKLLDTDEKKAFRILKYMIDVVCHISVVKAVEEIKNPVKNLDDFALFLLKIPCLSKIKTKEEKIKKCIIHHMGYKVYDLIAAHFILEDKANSNLPSRNKKPPGRENGIVFGIITILVKNTDFEKFIISCITPVIDVMNSKKVNISKGCHLFLKSSNNTPTIGNLNGCDIKIRNSQPRLFDYSCNSSVEQSKAHSQNSIYVFVQPIAAESPIEIYFVDRRGAMPVIIPLNLPEDIAALTVMLFPLGKNNMCYDKTSIKQEVVDIIALHTGFYLRDFPAIIKKGKDKYFIHAPLGGGTLQVIQFTIDDPLLMECLNQFGFDNSDPIWISPGHYPLLYKAVLAQGGKDLMKVYHYIGDAALLKNAFQASIDMLFEPEKYPPEVQRILHDFAKVNKDELLGYVLTRFISPVIKFYGSNSTNDTLQFWCQEIIAYAMQALTTSENKRVSYQKRIEQSLLDLIYSKELRTKVNQMCSRVSNIDKRILDFKIRFKEPLTQLAKDAGVFEKMTAEKHADTLTLPFEAHIEIFSRKLEQLKCLLEKAKETQKIKEVSLSELEKDEHELMILCYWYQNKFKTEVKLSDIISTIEINRREQAQKQYGLILMSAFEKIKEMKLDDIDFVNETWECLKNIKTRAEYIDYKQLSEQEQLIALIRKICNKICNKKIWNPSDGPIISPIQVADCHFECLKNLKENFEIFIEEQKKEVPKKLEEENSIAGNRLILQQNVDGVNTFGLMPLPKSKQPSTQSLNPQQLNLDLPKSPNPLNINSSNK